MPHNPIPHIAIIGGGFAGVVTAIKLVRATSRPLRISIIESRSEIGRGIAYSTRNHAHLVNGPAKNFTLYSEQPHHLADWLRNQSARDGWTPPAGIDYADSFPPRYLYGDYVQAELENTLSESPHPIEFRHLVERAEDLRPGPDETWTVELASGRFLRADRVVLATGLFSLSLERGNIDIDPTLTAQGRVIDDLWNATHINGLAGDQDVLVIGSSLSALDAMIHAHTHGFRGNFHTVSRRGLLVATRRDVQPWPAFLDPQALPRTLQELLLQIKGARRAIKQSGEDWQRLAGSVRPQLPALWALATLDERKRFIRHLRPYWEQGLHRAAPESGAWLENTQDAGRHHKLTGRVIRLAPAADGRVAVTWRPRGAHSRQTLLVDRVFNTQGFEFDWNRIDDTLVRNLVDKGRVVSHATGFGIDADPATGQVIVRDGVVRNLYAVGHPLRGVSWESNAIGEQIAGATATAQTLAQSLQSSLAQAA